MGLAFVSCGFLLPGVSVAAADLVAALMLLLLCCVPIAMPFMCVQGAPWPARKCYVVMRAHDRGMLMQIKQLVLAWWRGLVFTVTVLWPLRLSVAWLHIQIWREHVVRHLEVLLDLTFLVAWLIASVSTFLLLQLTWMAWQASFCLCFTYIQWMEITAAFLHQ